MAIRNPYDGKQGKAYHQAADLAGEGTCCYTQGYHLPALCLDLTV